MDMNGCKPLFGHNVVVATTVGKEFIGTLEPIPNSLSSVTLRPLPDATAANFPFAINGVNVLDLGVISFMQDLAQPH
jgi:hypothetical protein